LYYDDEFVAIDLPGGADLEAAAWTTGGPTASDM
jgi:hypothetical protein